MKNVYLLIIFIALLSCSNNKTIKESNSDRKLELSNEKSNDNKMIVNETSVIFLLPDSLELKKMQNENNEEAYNSIVDDITWYPGIAHQMLDSFKIKNIYCDKDLIVLRKADKSEIELKRKELNGNMIVFNVNKEQPIITYAISYNRDSVLSFLK